MTAPDWRLRRPCPEGREPWVALAERWGLDSSLARLAWLRGLEPEDLAWRLDPAWERTHDPYLMPEMGQAVTRIHRAVAEGTPITLYGDYDVDGVTATALLVRVLERLGARVDYFIPNRFNDGYGLHLDCIQELAARGPRLLVSVDCGIRSVEEVAASRELGLEWILTDHHALGPALPEAVARLHPQLGDYPNRHLPGVGVAFKLAQALLDAVPTPPRSEQPFLDGLLKLVALGCIADVVPLVGENALLTLRGLRALGGPNGPGLAALLQVARISGVPQAQALAFGPIPRLNAVGRMGGAEDAVRLLLTKDPAEAQALAARVEALNLERRAVQAALDERLPAPEDAALDLVLDPEAHKGVVGIVAAARMRRSGRPTLVCTLQEGMAHGSMRAPEGYDCCAMLEAARPYLASGGGHRAAAGVTFPRNHLAFVKKAMTQEAARQAAGLHGLDRRMSLDGEGWQGVPSGADLARLEPFGQGFPEPLVHLEGALERVQPFGEGHLRLTLAGVPQDIVWFRGESGSLPATGTRVALAASPQDHPRFGRSWRLEARLEVAP